ncbi:MAG: hypothetical protein HDS53_00535 [Barnesiella sp.]|nr:hypothetical protein [Barnesiella sp.]
MKRQTLSLTIEEIEALIKISDPEAQKEVMQSLIENSQTPKAELDRSDYSDAHPMALRIAEKFQRKAKAAECRRHKQRQPKPMKAASETKDASEQTLKIQISEDRTAILELNEATVGRLLWLKQNHKLWARAINHIIESIAGSDLPRRICRQIHDLLDHLFAYLNPLIAQASVYHKTPKQLRPRLAYARPIPLQ